MAMSFTLVASCREALSGVVATRLIREQEAEDAKAKAYEEVSNRIFERAERSEYMGGWLVPIGIWDQEGWRDGGCILSAGCHPCKDDWGREEGARRIKSRPE